MAKSQSQSQTCFVCNAEESYECEYGWDYRPRDKDVERGHERDENAKIYVYMCGCCDGYNRGRKLIGWDWWDAVGGLRRPDDSGTEVLCWCGKSVTMVHSTGGMMCAGCYVEYSAG
jgi:hypothetical protein